jgi:hypothetical protein
MAASITNLNTRRELAHRSADGIEVKLLWSKPDDELAVEVSDARLGEVVEFPVPRDRGLDAFYHPYAYLKAA